MFIFILFYFKIKTPEFKAKLSKDTVKRMDEGAILKRCGEEKMFISLSNNCDVYQWSGVDLYEGELNGGTYQAVLEMRNLYLGQSGNVHTFYPQWRICQARYAPQDVTFRKLRFLFKDVELPSTDEPAAHHLNRADTIVIEDDEEEEALVAALEQAEKANTRKRQADPRIVTSTLKKRKEERHFN